jgi:phosphohistidine phosphatase
MKRRLFIIRHAKSSWKHPELDDYDRPLNSRGKRDAPEMGQRLRKRSVRPDIIVSSPAARAKKTAQIIAEAIGYPKDKIEFEDSFYASDVGHILKKIKAFNDSCKEAMIFGHNPEFTSLANFLTKHYIDNLPTCGICCVEFDIPWSEVAENTGELLYFDYPKKLG